MKRLTERLVKLIQLLTVPFLLLSSGLQGYEVVKIETEDILQNDFFSILPAINWPESNVHQEVGSFNETFDFNYSVDFPYNVLSLQLTDDFDGTVNHLFLVVYINSEVSLATQNLLPNDCSSKSRFIICRVNEEGVELFLSETVVWEGGFVWLDSNIIVPASMADSFAHKVKSQKGALLSYSPVPSVKHFSAKHLPYFNYQSNRPVLVNMFKALSGAGGAGGGDGNRWNWRQKAADYDEDEDPVSEFNEALVQKLLKALNTGQLLDRRKIQQYARSNNLDENALSRWVTKQHSSFGEKRARGGGGIRQSSLERMRVAQGPYVYLRSKSMPAAGNPQTPQVTEPQPFFFPGNNIPILIINGAPELPSVATGSQQPTASEKTEEEPVEIDTRNWSPTYDGTLSSGEELESDDDDEGDIEEDDEDL